MTSVYDVFDDLFVTADFVLSSKSLHALRDFFFGFQKGLEIGGQPMKDGEPPFREFAQWLARKFGKLTPSSQGRWTKYVGGWWRILEEQFGNDDIGFVMFFELLREYRDRTSVRICHSTTPMEGERLDTFPMPVRFDVVAFPPENGFYLYFVFSDGSYEVEGYYNSLDELLSFAQKRYGIQFASFVRP